MCRQVKNSGSLNFLEPQGPVQIRNGIALPFAQYFVTSPRVRWNLFSLVITTRRRPHFTQRDDSLQHVASVSHGMYKKDDIHIWYGTDSFLSYIKIQLDKCCINECQHAADTTTACRDTALRHAGQTSIAWQCLDKLACWIGKLVRSLVSSIRKGPTMNSERSRPLSPTLNGLKIGFGPCECGGTTINLHKRRKER
jgi:hypothetical protein